MAWAAFAVLLLIAVCGAPIAAEIAERIERNKWSLRIDGRPRRVRRR